MLSKEQNELLCMTGLGTPCGEMLRRYWQPVGLSSEVKAAGKPRQVKVMAKTWCFSVTTEDGPVCWGFTAPTD